MTPSAIVLVPKNLSVVRSDESRRVDAVGSTCSDEIVDRRLVAFTRVIDQAEMNGD